VTRRVAFPWTVGVACTLAAGLVASAPGLGSAMPTQDPSARPAEATPAAVAPAPATAPPAPKKPETWDARYHSFEEVGALVTAWIDAGVATRVDVGASRGGLVVPAFEFGGAGPLALADRPTIFLVGGFDGVSLTGSESVLAIASDLIDKRAALPADVTFVAIPWASPDALRLSFAGRPGDGRDLLPLDDDGDLAVDEDSPDDVDKDGLVLDMLIEDPSGPLMRSVDPRFLAPAREGASPRYRLVREGRDDDKDGRFNEDPVGGVALDAAFPVGWSPTGVAGSAFVRNAPLPLEDPLSRAIADLVLARHGLAVLFFQGNHGEIARPGGTAETAEEVKRDAAIYDQVARLFTAATSRPQKGARALRDTRGADRPGSALDWVHSVPGALALEIAAWGPDVERGGETRDVSTKSARFETGDENVNSLAAPPVTAADRAWARWLDNTRGGIGFVDWHPVDLSDDTKVLVGGWEPFSRANAPAASLPAAVNGLSAFVLKLAQGAPRLSVELLEEKRDGDVVTLRWRVRNAGAISTGTSALSRGRPEHAPRCELVLPGGARLLWGETGGTLGDLAPGGASREITSVVLAPKGSAIQLRASCGWSATTVREVKP